MNLLFLTPGEREHLFAKLPAEIRSAWEPSVRDETIDAYEGPSELQKRMRESSFADQPQVKVMFDKLTEHLQEGKEFNTFSFDHFPSEALPSFLFMIGASGVEALLEMILQSPELTAVDMEGVASLSRARHRLLEVNAVLS